MPSLVAIRTSQPLLAPTISRYSYTFIDIPSSVAKADANGLAFKIALAGGQSFEGASKGHAPIRRVLDACGRVPRWHGASTLLAIARRCIQQYSTYVLDRHGNAVCDWHAIGMRLALGRIASRFNRYMSVTHGFTEATS